MTWLLTIALPVAYGVVALLALRPLAGHFAWSWALREARRKRRAYPSLYGGTSDADVEPSGDDWWGAYASAAVLLVAWPAVLLIYLTGRHGPAIGAEREGQLIQREAHVAKLERELGIGQD